MLYAREVFPLTARVEWALMTTGSLLVAGTTSDAGKSVLTAGICRWLARRGVRVAPFKAQNMSNNSMVAPDGAEIGRAQAMQAAAAGVPAEAAMNPVLLKPGSDLTSQLVVLGRAVGTARAADYWTDDATRARLRATVLTAYDDLRSRFDVVVCEGAGSPAEINLRRHDIVNLGLARARDLPVIVVGDIDRGGVFAALYGTLALLDRHDQSHVSGFVINKFRGSRDLLTPGLRQLADLTGRPVLGVLPYLARTWLDAEDAMATDDGYGQPGSAGTGQSLRVAVIRLPHVSNFTDVDALALEPGVTVWFTASPTGLADADLVVVPGTKATVGDLAWLRGRGLDAALADRAAAGRPILAICGGYQMLGTVIHDGVESQAGVVPGLGLLPVTTRFAAAKTLARPAGYAGEHPVTGYEIHHGIVDVRGGEAWLTSGPDGRGSALDGCVLGAIRGTLWHGILENDAFRRACLREIAATAGREFTPAPGTCFETARQAQFDALADVVGEYLDTTALLDLIERGPAPGLPVLRAGQPHHAGRALGWDGRGGSATMPGERRHESADLADYEVLDTSDTLADAPGDDPLDRGLATPERWSAAMKYGSTAAEQRSGRSLEQSLAREEPEDSVDTSADRARDDGWDENATEDDIGRLDRADGPDPRTGRLATAADDRALYPATDGDAVARDAGLDAGGATAEEASMHVRADGEAAV